MIPSALNLRLQQLEENISQVLQLLNEYEAELLDEDDPSKKSKYRRRVESLMKQKVGYEEEFTDLRLQLTNEYPFQTQTISSQLQEIDNKGELLLGSQAYLSTTLMFHFSLKEQKLLLPFTEKLDEPDLINIQAFLEAVESDQASEEEVQLILSETRTILKRVQEQNLALPADKEAVSEIINDPTIDAKHALKVSIPIIRHYRQ